jgi:hypothetical protein
MGNEQGNPQKPGQEGNPTHPLRVAKAAAVKGEGGRDTQG